VSRRRGGGCGNEAFFDRDGEMGGKDRQMEASYSRQAEAYLDKQEEKRAARIRRAIDSLPAGDVKKLREIEDAYRLRIGGVRVLFEKNGNRVHVIKIDNRGDVYK